MLSIDEEKKLLRKRCLGRRNAIDRKKAAEMDGRIFERVISSESFAHSTLLLCYVSARSEPDTLRLIDYALSLGKRVACPRCGSRAGEMDFYYIGSREELCEGAYSIMEPLPECEAVTELSDGLCIVPGMSFDRMGYRLGYGKGYYDRFLARFGGIRAGICYEELISEQPLPADRYDLAVNMLFTEQSVYKFA